MKTFLVVFAFFFSCGLAFAVAPSPGSLLTYEGVLTDAGGTPITTTQSVKFQILAGSCVVYEEAQNISPGSEGEFSVVVGAGTRTDVTNNTADRIFASAGSVECSGASNISVSGFGNRSLRIIVGTTTLSPDVTLGNVPSAINAQKLADKGVLDFVNVNSSLGVTQTNVESIFNRFSKLDALLGNFDSAAGTYAGSITGNAATATVATGLSGTLPLTSGGTGATSAAAARTNLGLAAIASSGSAADLSAGTVPSARLGTGTADATTFLRGDGTWAVPGGGGGAGDITDVFAGPGLTGGGTVGSVTLDLPSIGTAGTFFKVTTDGYGRVASGSTSLVATDIPSLDASKITGGTFATTLIPDLNVDKVTSASGKYFTYKPNGSVCGDGNVLKYDSSVNAGNGGWKCASDDSGGINFSGSLSGDVTGTQSATVVQKIKGKEVAGTAPANGQVLRFQSGFWTPSFVSMSDLRSNVTGSQYVTSCGAGQTLTFSSPADNLGCSNINITKSQISDFPDVLLNGGNTAAAAVSMGTKDANSVSILTNNSPRLFISSVGNVGLGTMVPAYDLDIGGPTNISRTAYLTTYGDGTNASRFLGYKYADDVGGGIPVGERIVEFGSNRDGSVTGTAGMVVMSSEAHTGAVAGMKLDFRVTKNGGTTANSAMSIENDGRVSMGNTFAGALNGPGLSSISPSQNRLEITGRSETPYAYSNGTLLLTNNSPSENAADELGAILFAHRAGSNVRAKISSLVTGVSPGNGGGTLVFYTKQDGASTFSERMRVIDKGNVGIGTTDPRAMLDINGQVRLKKNSSAPEACTSAIDGTIALTVRYSLCVCNGTQWVVVGDGSSSITCMWN